MSDTQQLDHQFARGPLGQLLAQMIEHVTVRVAGPELIAIDKVQQRHGFATQRMDHVPIIDHVAALAIAAWPAARESEDTRAADEQLHAIVKQMSARTVADQPRGYRI